VDYKTMAHEVAHYIDFRIRGISCHDDYWQTIMNSMCVSENYLDSQLKENDNELYELNSFEYFDETEWEYNGKYYLNIFTGEKSYRGSKIFNELFSLKNY
jgi:predicted SprT family Zn-dependent metalloprotease